MSHFSRETYSLALVTIGQSPRHDYTSDLTTLLPPNTTLTQHGALDRLTLPDIQAHLSPSSVTKKVLVSRMRDGTEVKMDAERLEPLVRECVQHVASEETPEAILLLCTGNLPTYDIAVPVIRPQDTVRRYFEGGKKGMNLVIISPEKRQVAPAKARWDGVGESVVLGGTAATPYGETSTAQIETAAKWVANLPEMGRSMVYMDCMGYTLEHKRLVEKITKGRIDEVVVPREVVFRAAAKLFDSSI